NVALWWRANSQLNSAVRAPPMWRKPVGEGAKRVTIVILEGPYFLKIAAQCLALRRAGHKYDAGAACAKAGVRNHGEFGMRTSRRDFLAGSVVGLVGCSQAIAAPAASQGGFATPTQETGPFYPVVGPGENIVDLTRPLSGKGRALGEAIEII